MKTYCQFSEDLAKRRADAIRRSREQLASHRQSQRQSSADAEERRRLKDEIKRELKSEQ